MATFAIEIPDEQVERILTALCANYQYDATISDPNSDNPQDTIDNPQTPYQFANEIVRKYLVENTVSYEAKLARQQAMNSLDAAPVITDPAI